MTNEKIPIIQITNLAREMQHSKLRNITVIAINLTAVKVTAEQNSNFSARQSRLSSPLSSLGPLCKFSFLLFARGEI